MTKDNIPNQLCKEISSRYDAQMCKRTGSLLPPTSSALLMFSNVKLTRKSYCYIAVKVSAELIQAVQLKHIHENEGAITKTIAFH